MTKRHRDAQRWCESMGGLKSWSCGKSASSADQLGEVEGRPEMGNREALGGGASCAKEKKRKKKDDGVSRQAAAGGMV